VDCSTDEIAALVGIVRNRLGVFLQSVNIEVQERASTLRHLLADLEILSMTWENAAVVAETPEAETGGVVMGGGGGGKGGKKGGAGKKSKVVHDSI
jgi:hypothetical protein